MLGKYSTILMGKTPEIESESNLSANSAMFGSVGRMSSSIEEQDGTRRIAIYPCVGVGDAGTGLLLILGHLLAGAKQVKIYPVILQINDEVISETPFTPDEWVLDGLDDDAAIWGTLTEEASEFTLRVFVEDDIADGQLTTFERKASHWQALLNVIADLAGEITEVLGVQHQLPQPTKVDIMASSEAIKAYSAEVFRFHRELLMAALNEVSLEVFPSSQHLSEATNQIDTSLITGVTSAVLGYETVLRNQLDLLGTGEFYRAYSANVLHWEQGIAVFSLAVLNSDQASNPALTTWCLEQLESIVGSFPNLVANWIALSIFYDELQRPDLAIDVCQRALEAEIRDDSIYFAYADALDKTIEKGFSIDHFVLNANAVMSEDGIKLERVMSLEAGIASSSKPDSERLSQYIIAAAKHEKMSEIYPAFERLTQLDIDGKFVEIVIQQLAYLEDFQWMIEPLDRATQQGGFQAWLNLAKAAFMTDEVTRCKTAAQQALTAATTPQQRSEAQVVLLELDVAAFQSDFADILGRLQQKGGEVFERDLEFLEYTVENAPDYAEGYLALAVAYRRLDEPNTALEVLLDAEKATKGTPEIYLALADLFEQEDELTLAIENVQKGLDLAPANVPLLAQAALLAYLSDDEDASQAFLRRAHAISPYDRRIIAVTRRIQDSDSEDDQEIDD